MSEFSQGNWVNQSAVPPDDLSTFAMSSEPMPQYRPYHPPDYTPPSSPRFHGSPALPSIGSFSPRLPPQAAAYERETYTPPPSASPPLHPLTSPGLRPRQNSGLRARHGPLPSPLNDGFPRAEQPASPTLRNFPGAAVPSDLRTLYNPLTSNPVNPGAWRESRDDLSLGPIHRARGQTTSSAMPPHNPPLRSVASIPDYTPIRTSSRINPSGTYRPDRGGTNWSQNDNYPIPVRNWPAPGTDEARSSFRSGWTNDSSAFLDNSGTERSSVFTKRSSVSDNRASIESRMQFDRQSGRSYSDERQSSYDDTASYSIKDKGEGHGDYYDDGGSDDVMDMIAMYEDDDDGNDNNDQSDDEELQKLDTNEVVSDEGYISQTTANTGAERVGLQREDSAVTQASSLDKSVPSGDDGPHADSSVHPIIERPPASPRTERAPPTPAKASRSSRDLLRVSRKISLESIINPLPESAVSGRPRRNSNSIVERHSRLLLSGPPQILKSSTFNVGSGQSKGSVQTSAADASSHRVPFPPHQLPPPMAPVPRDQYGFKKETRDISLREYDNWHVKYEEHVARRTKKWEALMRKHSLPTENPVRFPPRSERVKRYIRKGIPPKWRGAAWFFYSNGPELMKGEMKGVYRRLVEQCQNGMLNDNDKDLIDRDLHRTFPDNILFRPEMVPGAESLSADAQDAGEEAPIIHGLRRVLQAFALNNPSIGYCQSLNFIAGLLLLFLHQDEEKAFIMLTIITRQHLPGAHAKNLLNVDIGVLMMLIRQQMPAVWASINDIEALNSGPGTNAHPTSNASRLPTVSLATTSWFMSLFIGSLPIETVLRVWDQFLYEGSRVLFRVALAIFRTGEAQIKQCKGPDKMDVFQVVQTLPRKCVDPNALIDRVYSGRSLFNNLSQADIEERRAWWKKLLTNDRMSRGAQQLAVPETAQAEKPSLRRKASKKFKQPFRGGR